MLLSSLFLIFKFILGVESGASFPWSQKWQKGFLRHVPEIVTAAILTVIAMHGWGYIFDVSIFVVLPFFLIIYAGIQSATWMFLRWESHDDPNTKRSSTTKPLVDLIANKFGWKLGDEGYAWTAAAVKGTIITLPMGGLGGLLFALGYEIGSHAKGRVDKWFNPHIVPEGLSFVGVGLYAIAFLKITSMFAM